MPEGEAVSQSRKMDIEGADVTCWPACHFCHYTSKVNCVNCEENVSQIVIEFTSLGLLVLVSSN